MARDGSGNYNLLTNSWNPAVNGASATAPDWQSLVNDIAAAIGQSISKDGQTVVTGDLNLGSKKIKSLADGTLATDAATIGQVQTGAWSYLTSVSGADTITASTTSPSPTAYVAGQQFRFIAAGTNTTSVTLNVNSLGAKAITKFGSIALAAGDIPSGSLVSVCYDGTRFQLVGGLSSVGAKGGGADDIFYENSQTVTTDYTLTTNKNAMTAGPITINTGVTITVPTGATWSVV